MENIKHSILTRNPNLPENLQTPKPLNPNEETLNPHSPGTFRSP